MVPKANFVRLMGLFWDNFLTEKDCRSEDREDGYFKPECLEIYDGWVRELAAEKVWIIITGRAEYAAG